MSSRGVEKDDDRYRERRDEKPRSRSRSRERFRRDNERPIDAHGRDVKREIRRDRPRDRSRSRDRRDRRSRSRSRDHRDRDRDNPKRDDTGKSKDSSQPKLSKAQIIAAEKAEAERKLQERLALVRQMTVGDDDEEGIVLGNGENDDEDGDGVIGLGIEGLTPEEEMQRMMGFGGFDSTKGKVVVDNHEGAARGLGAKNKGRKYRQYMNRRGGFNKLLAKVP